MGKFIDITGKKFGTLTPIFRTKDGEWGSVVWKCLCNCGNHKNASYNNLMQGNVRACGSRRCRPTFKDLSGKVFGNLKVLKLYENVIKNKHAEWTCECKCGKIVIVWGTRLIRGTTKSCGTYKCKPNFKDLTGKIFENLIVIKQSERKGKRAAYIGNVRVFAEKQFLY